MGRLADMARTRISPRTDRGENGLTLVELLVTLAVLSLATGMVLSAGVRLMSGLELRRVADTLVTDLKHARLAASLSGQAVTIARTEDGYQIPAIGITRTLPSGTRIDWPLEAGPLQFMIDGSSTGGRLRIVRGKREALISVDPLLGLVRREE